MGSEVDNIQLNPATIKFFIKVVGLLLSIFVSTIPCVWYISSKVSTISSGISVQFQQMHDELALQNSQMNNRIDYLQGEIDADCFGRTSRYRKQAEYQETHPNSG